MSIVVRLIHCIMLVLASNSPLFSQNIDSFQTAKPDTSVILEIIRGDYGMTSLPGTFIYLRVRSDGRAEYETTKQSESAPRSTSYRVRNEVVLSSSEVNQLIQLGSQSSFLSALDKYPAVKRFTDSGTVTTIRFFHSNGVKQIEIVNYSPEVAEVARYPKPLVDIMEKARALREQ